MTTSATLTAELETCCWYPCDHGPRLSHPGRSPRRPTRRRGPDRPSFRLKLAAKDAGLVTDAAWQHGLSLPVLEAIARRFCQAATEHGDHDISATYLASLSERAA